MPTEELTNIPRTDPAELKAAKAAEFKLVTRLHILNAQYETAIGTTSRFVKKRELAELKAAYKVAHDEVIRLTRNERTWKARDAKSAEGES
jgi:hypothetical protein